MKEKIPEYATLYPNMTKRERYNLIIAEWKKSQEESKKKSSPTLQQLNNVTVCYHRV